MGNKPCNTQLFDRAADFAVKAHSGTERRGAGYPYVLHTMEAASIVASITNDEELLAAALLHDVVEDTEISLEEIRENFGDRVADLVAAESDAVYEGQTEAQSWHARKQAAITRLGAASHEAKIVALGDKLSNMRAIARDYEMQGDTLWEKFHCTDPRAHEWHYRGLADSLSELADTPAYREFLSLIEKTFSSCKEQ